MAETTRITDNNGGSSPGNAGSLGANTVLLRRYKVLGVLGGGGMGTVYQARDLNFPDVRRLAAVKEMHTPATDRSVRDNMLATFRREANILATLQHPAIPRIYDFFDQNDRAYLVMEYINGSDLEVLLSKTKSLPIDKIIEWAIDLCDVLAYLHSHQPEPIVFRDMKPSNVMIDNLGKVRLIDFGIARTFDPNQQKGYTMIGTEGYSSPEQYKGSVSHLSDQYALGATLHHILTRKDPRLEPPFSFSDRPIRDFSEEVPSWFADIVNRALEHDPVERFPSCAEMADAIKAGSRVVVQANARSPEGATSSIMGQDIQPVWTFKTEDEIRTGPVAFGESVFVGSYDTNVWALKVSNGEFLWKYPTQGGIASSPAVDASTGLILFGSEDHTFNALDHRSGRIAWSYATKDRVRSSPTLAMDHVFFGSDDGNLYAMVASNGRSMWSFSADAPIRTKPYVYEDIIIFGTDIGEILGVTLSGERKWSRKVKRSTESSPIVDDREALCYIGSHDGFLYALDVSTGFITWRFRTAGPVISSPTIYDKYVIVGSVDGNVYGVDLVTGREKWRFATEGPIVSSPVVRNQTVYIGGTDKHLYCLDAKNGKEIWKFQSDGKITSTPYLAEELVIFGALDNTVYALPILD